MDDAALSHVAFRLVSGTYEASVEPEDRVPDPRSSDIIGALTELEAEDCIVAISLDYLPPLKTGSVAEVSGAAQMRLFRQVLSVCEEVHEHRRAVDSVLYGLVVFGASPAELWPLVKVLQSLSIRKVDNSSFRARDDGTVILRLGSFSDECNPAGSLDGFINCEFESDEEAVQVFTREWCRASPRSRRRPG